MRIPSREICADCGCNIAHDQWKRWQNDYFCAECYERNFAEQERAARADGLLVAGGWNARNMFFLTRDVREDNHVKITSAVELYHYGNQVSTPVIDTLDDFGRNCLDKAFIRLCYILWSSKTHFGIDSLHETDIPFQSLLCKKIGDEFIVTVHLQDTTLEMELIEMVNYFESK